MECRGKFLSARRLNSKVSAEMFIDLTPGTPRIYRREALTRLFTVGYDVERNVLFGTDNVAHSYSTPYLESWRRLDLAVMEKLHLPKATVAGYLGENLLRFVGETSGSE